VPYDDALVERVRARLGDAPSVVELKMFGGWGITIRGNMAVGVMDRDLIVRVGPDGFDELVAKPGARPFDFTGRPMRGWLFVDGKTVTSGRSLNAWVDRGVEYARSLPPKAAKKRR
jgi:TfoX/Sxy family transcriptional regulator of competence genes